MGNTKNLNFARGTLGVRINNSKEAPQPQQPLDLAEIFSSRGVKLTGADF